MPRKLCQVSENKGCALSKWDAPCIDGVGDVRNEGDATGVYVICRDVLESGVVRVSGMDCDWVGDGTLLIITLVLSCDCSFVL